MTLLQSWRHFRPHLQHNLKLINKVRGNIHSKNRNRLGSTLNVASEDVPDFGDYSIILPPEPVVFGVSHIKPRLVPPHIPKPPYADASRVALNEDFGGGKGERLVLGGESEFRIREAAKLAKKVRVYAGSLVQVRVILYSIRVIGVLILPVRNLKGWCNNRQYRRGRSRVYHRSRRLSLSATLFRFSTFLLYEVCSHLFR